MVFALFFCHKNWKWFFAHVFFFEIAIKKLSFFSKPPKMILSCILLVVYLFILSNISANFDEVDAKKIIKKFQENTKRKEENFSRGKAYGRHFESY